jgi:N-acetylglucosamine-6-phosphate deacetylase
MNREAAKAVKYGGVKEDEALKFVTLNPARQLGIDHRVGSLEPGKDGDLVVWSGHPLSADSVCLQTWIEGRQYFERAGEVERVEKLRSERETLLARVKKASSGKKDDGDGGRGDEDSGFFFRSALEMDRSFDYSCCEGH